MALGFTRVFGSNKLNDLRFGFGKLKNGHISPRANVDNVVGRLGINLPSDNPLYWGVPNIGITGLSGIGEESDAPFINDDTTLQIVDNFTWTLGKHSFKFGGELRHVRYDQIGGVVTRGRWAFDGRYTQNPLLPAAQRGGAAFADFLLGTLQPLGGAGRRADRELPIQLLRALRAGQLEGLAEPDGQLRPALGVRPAVRRRERRDREHRLRLGQHPRAGVRAHRDRRSLRGRPGLPAGSGRAVRARRPVRARRLPDRLQRLRAAAGHRLDGRRRRPWCAPAAASTTCATSATRCSTRSATRRSPSGATSRPRRSGRI